MIRSVVLVVVFLIHNAVIGSSVLWADDDLEGPFTLYAGIYSSSGSKQGSYEDFSKARALGARFISDNANKQPHYRIEDGTGKTIEVEGRGEVKVSQDRITKSVARSSIESGHSWFDKREYDQAIRDYTEALRLNPESAVAHTNRGAALLQVGKVDEAIRDSTVAIRLDPEDVSPLLNRAMAWSRKNELRKAAHDCSAAIRLDPKLIDAYLIRGRARYTNGEFDDSIDDYTEAIRLDPKNAKTYHERGHVWEEKGKAEEAIGDYNDTVRLDPKDAQAYWHRGNLWAKKGNADRAIREYTQAIQVEPQLALPYNSMAWLRATWHDAKFRDGREAVKLAVKAIELEPLASRYCDTLAAAFAETGDFSRAIDWQIEAIVRCQADGDPTTSLTRRLELYLHQKPFRESSLAEEYAKKYQAQFRLPKVPTVSDFEE